MNAVKFVARELRCVPILSVTLCLKCPCIPYPNGSNVTDKNASMSVHQVSVPCRTQCTILLHRRSLSSIGSGWPAAESTLVVPLPPTTIMSHYCSTQRRFISQLGTTTLIWIICQRVGWCDAEGERNVGRVAQLVLGKAQPAIGFNRCIHVHALYSSRRTTITTEKESQ